MYEAYKRTRKDGAVGVDGQSAAEYAQNLEENLKGLLDRFKSGAYKAPPVRRKHIPKDGNRTRPIGIPTFEDKVLQRAVSMEMEAVYEQDFYDFSYGFRPEKSAHQALQKVWSGVTRMGGCWLIEVDIKGYFDNIVHKFLREILDLRVRDGVIRRTIDKWLKAGVLEEGVLSYPEKGSPQGGVISPILANIYLHEVMDKWFVTEVQRRLRGRGFMVRYADDIIIALNNGEDVRRLMDVLPKRFGRYGLELHATKTRVVDFSRPGPLERKGKDSFDFLGFTHYWGKSRKGHWTVKRKTAASRFTRACKAFSQTCREIRHMKVSEQWKTLTRKIIGHNGYYGITGNWEALAKFHYACRRAWQKWLNRRSSRNHMPWNRFEELEKRYPLPRPRVVHSVYRR
jgi:group II intron reverse transcriptase/maturase